MWLKWGVPRKLPWLPAGGNVWEGGGTFRGTALLEKADHWSRVWGFYSLALLPASLCFLSVDQVWSASFLSVQSHAPASMSSPPWWNDHSHPLWNSKPKRTILPQVAFCHGVQFNNIKITNTLAKNARIEGNKLILSSSPFRSYKGKGPTLPNKAFPD